MYSQSIKSTRTGLYYYTNHYSIDRRTWLSNKNSGKLSVYYLLLFNNFYRYFIIIVINFVVCALCVCQIIGVTSYQGGVGGSLYHSQGTVRGKKVFFSRSDIEESALSFFQVENVLILFLKVIKLSWNISLKGKYHENLMSFQNPKTFV